MNIDRLRYFSVVVGTKNLRKAAEILRISPGALSKAMATLEREVGASVLRPEGRGIEITPEGIEIHRRSIPLLEEALRFEQHNRASSVRSLDRMLKVGTFEVFSSYFVSAFACQELADERLRVLEMTPGLIEDGISAGLVDFGLTYLPAPHPELAFIEVGSFRMGIFGRSKWAAAEFEKWPFAIPMTSVGVVAQAHGALDMWPRMAPRRFVKYEFELLETALQTSRTGRSVLHCPDFIVNLQNRQVAPALRLERLPYPRGYGAKRRVAIFLVGKKGNAVLSSLEKKMAKFCRLTEVTSHWRADA